MRVYHNLFFTLDYFSLSYLLKLSTILSSCMMLFQLKALLLKLKSDQ